MLPAFALLAITAAGCAGFPGKHAKATVPPTVPRELSKTVLPPYRIEPPDLLLIDAVRVIPRQPYRLNTLDTLLIRVQGTISDAPIDGIFPVELGGTVNLGPAYGAVGVVGMTLDEARLAIETNLRRVLREPVVTVSINEIAGKQQIAGQHLVGPDGTVTLGTYGGVVVVGMTLAEAKWAIEQHLAQFLDRPEVSIDVYGYNSKVFYIITQGAGMGDAVYRFPITGNETVLDALSQINGMTAVSSKKIWIARPSCDPCAVQVLPVDWEAITAAGQPGTNYQLMPGDRVFIAEDKLVALDTGMGKLLAPIERAMGFSLFGVGVATRFSGNVLKGGGNMNSNF